MKTCKEMIRHIDTNQIDLLVSLYERWQDEKDYEDFNDYVKAFKKKVPETVKGSKRPFGFTVKCSDGNLRVTVKVVGRTKLQVNFSY